MVKEICVFTSDLTMEFQEWAETESKGEIKEVKNWANNSTKIFKQMSKKCMVNFIPVERRENGCFYGEIYFDDISLSHILIDMNVAISKSQYRRIHFPSLFSFPKISIYFCY